jgi:hypothetical protein
MRRFLALFLLAIATAWPGGTPDAFSDRVVKFHQHWDRFLRAYFCCPKGAVSTDQCSPQTGVLDYQEFFAARREAKALFDLTEAR